MPSKTDYRRLDVADERRPALGIWRTPAFGQAGVLVRQRLPPVETHRAETRYQRGNLEALLQQLVALMRDPDQGPIDGASFVIAEAFLRSLTPEDLPDEVGVDPDGEATFDWGQAGSRFAVSVSRHSQLAFAGLFSGEVVKGSELFLGDQIPANILDGIRRCRG